MFIFIYFINFSSINIFYSYLIIVQIFTIKIEYCRIEEALYLA